MVERRFSELGFDFIIQGREDKGHALKYLADQLRLRIKRHMGRLP